MAMYQYTAVNDAGEKTKGEVFAQDKPHLSNLLNQQGLWLLQCKTINNPEQHTPSRIKVSRREMIDLFTAFSTMLKAGVPLLDTINALAQNTPNEGLAYVLTMMHADVESGMPLSQTMEKHQTIFPTQVTSVIKAGEHSGQLPATFIELRQYYQWLANLMGDIKQASTYPLIIFFVVCLFILILFTFVVPRFTDMLNGLGVALPMVTSLVIDLSTFTLQYWWLILGTPIILWMGVRWLYKRSTSFANAFDDFKLNLPVFGDINRMIALSRFTHHFSIMFRSGIQILECLQHCRELVGNAKLAVIIHETEKNVREGRNMSETLTKHDAFPPMLLQMIKVGEATGDLDTAMNQVSLYYDEEIPRRVKRVFSILEPIIMLMLIGVVGTVAIAIFLPMVSMLGGIK
ncbi:MAG: type II secretion system F family protein [Ghiorsea sp.]|nr:type II secretion system F family protein [Ghiorsea sp.]